MAITLSDKLKSMLRDWLDIDETNIADVDYKIYADYSFKGNANKNLIWYRGNANELSQFYGTASYTPEDQQSFWGATATKGLEIRKLHTGIPKLMVDKLAGITLSDLNSITIDDDAGTQNETWTEISKENNIEKQLLKATKNALITGDTAFKITFDENISKLPIIQFFGGQNVDYIYEYGRLREIKFYTRYKNNFTLEETYGHGYIKYKLYKKDKLAKLTDLDATAGLEDVIWDTNKQGWDTMLAGKLCVYESETYEGRGASIFDGKTDVFDALDECLSQWMDALRSGRTKTYIPNVLIPKDTENGTLLKPNAFDCRFITVGTDMSPDAKNEIKTVSPDIKTDPYLTTWITLLDNGLQGWISPSTLGIDVKKLDNAESQREKEKTTLYTRQNIVDALTETIKELVKVSLTADAIQNGKTIEIDMETISVVFGEYANPSFEAVVETMSNPNTPISIETKVEEIWGDTKDEEWKKEEVKRIKEEQGIIMMDEPAVGLGMLEQQDESINTIGFKSSENVNGSDN